MTKDEEKKFNQLLKITSVVCGVTIKKILSKFRGHRQVMSRKIVSMILIKYLHWPISKAARAMDKNHSTIIKAYRDKHKADYTTNYMNYKNDFNKVLNEFVETGGLKTKDFNKKIMDKLSIVEFEVSEIKKMIIDG